MLPTIVVTLAVSSLLAACSSPEASPADSTLAEQPTLTHPELVDELIAMAERDQEPRLKYEAIDHRDSTRAAEREQLKEAFNAVDLENTSRLMQIVEEVGWPTKEMVGKEGAMAAWVILQHADHEPAFQEQMLERLRPLVAAGDFDKKLFAMLTDRARMTNKKPQYYGTQFLTITLEGVAHFGLPYGLADRETVDERRAQMGLPPLEEEMRRQREAYDLPEDTPDLPADLEVTFN